MILESYKILRERNWINRFLLTIVMNKVIISIYFVIMVNFLYLKIVQSHHLVDRDILNHNYN